MEMSESVDIKIICPKREPEDSVLVCKDCSRCFTDEAQLLQHCHQAHPVVCDPFPCDQCEKTFKYRCRLEEHYRLHTGEKPYECQYCFKCFHFRKDLRMHLISHMGGKPHDCKEVHPDVNLFGETLEHKCLMCTKFFRYPCCLEYHSRKHGWQKRVFLCQYCNRALSGKRELKQHIRRHCEDEESGTEESKHVDTESLQFKCERCDRRFQYRCRLERHLQKHSGHPVLQCEMCNASFCSGRDLGTHHRHHLEEMGDTLIVPDVLLPFRCDICTKAFRHKSRLEIHYRTHTRVKSFQCEFCRKLFSYNKDLRMHVLTNHMGETRMRHYSGGEEDTDDFSRPFACDRCDEVFSDIVELDSHIQEHMEQEKPFACEFCPKAFAVKRHLKAHIISHLEEPPVRKRPGRPRKIRCDRPMDEEQLEFPCKLCGETFERMSLLLSHQKLHAGEEPFICRYCRQGFTTKQDMLRHMLMHSKEKPHECLVCGAKFRRRELLKEHAITHSLNVMPEPDENEPMSFLDLQINEFEYDDSISDNL